MYSVSSIGDQPRRFRGARWIGATACGALLGGMLVVTALPAIATLPWFDYEAQFKGMGYALPRYQSNIFLALFVMLAYGIPVGGLQHLALTDSNVLFGAVAFARACREQGIRPITGMTAAVAAPPEDLTPDQSGSLGRLVLLAAGPEGYRSLCRLSSLYQTDPDRERRRRTGFSWDEIGEHRAGLICLTGGRAAYADSTLLRRLRDVLTARQHIMFGQSHRPLFAKTLAGEDTFAPPFIV